MCIFLVPTNLILDFITWKIFGEEYKSAVFSESSYEHVTWWCSKINNYNSCSFKTATFDRLVKCCVVCSCLRGQQIFPCAFDSVVYTIHGAVMTSLGPHYTVCFLTHTAVFVGRIVDVCGNCEWCNTIGTQNTCSGVICRIPKSTNVVFSASRRDAGEYKHATFVVE